MLSIEEIKENSQKFFKEINSCVHHRYLSWDHCYYQFKKARQSVVKDYDSLSLHLTVYLASYGMYRGSSFLLQRDYKVHTDPVKEILKPEYDCLLGISCRDLIKNENIEKLNQIYESLRNYYDNIRKTVKDKETKFEVSDVLITKILMGTLGCLPAYDRYFVSGIKNTKVACGTYGKKSINQLANFYIANEEELEKIRKNMLLKNDNTLYPQMKLLDLAFWEIGAFYESN